MATLRINIEEARGLPIMDGLSNSTDAYVEVRHGESVRKTTVFKRSLNPRWHASMKIDVTNLETLQEDPVEIRVFDKDMLSRDGLIGTFFFDLNSMLQQGKEPSLHQWFPLHDTLKGLQGEIFMRIRIKFFSEQNPFCPTLPHHVPHRFHGGDGCGANAAAFMNTADTEGVHLFSTSRVDPAIHRVETIVGLVEELFVKPDPEHSTFQSLRSSRVTNDARILQMYKLSGKVRRQLGKKVLELGCNCVLGYQERYDLEPDNGIIIRAVGTACVISRVDSEEDGSEAGAVAGTGPGGRPKKSEKSRGGDDDDMGDVQQRRRHLRNVAGLTRSQVALITLSSLPPGVIRKMGSSVSAQSVKVVTSQKAKAILTQQRDHWWSEIREEIKANAKSMRCNAVVAYRETAEYHEDIVVLYATGTAVIVDPKWTKISCGPEEHMASLRRGLRCTVAHSPIMHASSQGERNLCEICGRKPVPDYLLATCELPPDLGVDRETRLIDVRVVRKHQRLRGEALAIDISQHLPYIHYMLHKQMIYKLQLCKLNAAFGLRISLSIGPNHIIGNATATGVFVTALPEPETVNVEELFAEAGADERSLSILRCRLDQIQRHNVPSSDSSSTTDDSTGNESTDDSDNLAIALDDPESLLGLADSAAVADTLCINVESLPADTNYHSTVHFLMLQRRYNFDDVGESELTLYTTKCCGDAREYLTYKLAQMLPLDVRFLSYELEARLTQYNDLHITISGLIVQRDTAKGKQVDLMVARALAKKARALILERQNHRRKHKHLSHQHRRRLEHNRSSSRSGTPPSDLDDDHSATHPNHHNNAAILQQYFDPQFDETTPSDTTGPSPLTTVVAQTQTSLAQASSAGGNGGSTFTSQTTSSAFNGVTHQQQWQQGTGSARIWSTVNQTMTTEEQQAIEEQQQNSGVGADSTSFGERSRSGPATPLTAQALRSLSEHDLKATVKCNNSPDRSCPMNIGGDVTDAEIVAAVAALAPFTSSLLLPSHALHSETSDGTGPAPTPVIGPIDAASGLAFLQPLVASAVHHHQNHPPPQGFLVLESSTTFNIMNTSADWSRQASSTPIFPTPSPYPPVAGGASSNLALQPDVLITPLSFVGGHVVVQYIGRVSQHFLREVTHVDHRSRRYTAGLGSFHYNLMLEANCVVTRLVSALGGNVILNYEYQMHVMNDSDEIKGAYQLITITGHAAKVIPISAIPST